MHHPPAWFPTGRPMSRALGVCIVLLGLGSIAPVSAQQPPTPQQQDPEDDALSKILTEDKLAETSKKDRLRPPIELSRSQVMPNDVLPYIKANHWAMIGLEMRANHNDYDGSLQSRPVGLLDQPNEMIYRRDARLIKGQQVRLTMPILLPTIPKELGFQLIRPDAIRQDEDWPAALKVLEPHQQLVVVLANESNDVYSRWAAMRSTIPLDLRKDDPMMLDKHRYYRMVLPLDPEKPLLSPHPLTWTPISHVIWDGMPPERLGVGQQQAMLDWLHWGGQLVIVGGAGPAFAPLRESFLAPYLPGEPSGENVSRSGEQLAPLAQSYPPSVVPVDSEGEVDLLKASWIDIWNRAGRRYKPPASIKTDPKKPIFITALKPKAGASTIPLGGPDNPPLAVEWRVGRGRVMMLAVSLSDPDLSKWEGYDTLIRRVVLRRPEEPLVDAIHRRDNGQIDPAHFATLDGPDLTSVRYLARDLGAPIRKPPGPDTSLGYTVNGFSPEGQTEVPVGEWLDSAILPITARDMLEKASGIEIPSPRFVLKVILAYLLTLVPLNWLICRYVIGRREWAWVVVPVLSFAFAVGVERAAAYDVGYDSSCDEVDVVETHGNYPRAHLSRFASIYSTGRVRFTIAYPNDASALALPLATGRSLRGEDVIQSSLRTLPNPALSDFLVQPRSLSLFRAEQMPSLPGTVAITLSDDNDAPKMVANNFGFDLADAWVVKVSRTVEEVRGVHLGSIAAGASVPLGDLDELEIPEDKATPNTLDPGPFENLLLRTSVSDRPEDLGEVRLIGRVDKLMPGQTIDPPVDRHRGFTLLVAHLEAAPLPKPDSSRYTSAVVGGESIPPDPRTLPAVPSSTSTPPRTPPSMPTTSPRRRR